MLGRGISRSSTECFSGAKFTTAGWDILGLRYIDHRLKNLNFENWIRVYLWCDFCPTGTSPYAWTLSQIRRREDSRSPPAVLKASASIVSGAPRTTSGAPYS